MSTSRPSAPAQETPAPGSWVSRNVVFPREQRRTGFRYAIVPLVNAKIPSLPCASTARPACSAFTATTASPRTTRITAPASHTSASGTHRGPSRGPEPKRGGRSAQQYTSSVSSGPAPRLDRSRGAYSSHHHRAGQRAMASIGRGMRQTRHLTRTRHGSKRPNTMTPSGAPVCGSPQCSAQVERHEIRPSMANE